MFTQESLQHLCKSVATSIAADRRCFMVIENAEKELKSNAEFKKEILDEIMARTIQYLPKEIKENG